LEIFKLKKVICGLLSFLLFFFSKKKQKKMNLNCINPIEIDYGLNDPVDIESIISQLEIDDTPKTVEFFGYIPISKFNSDLVCILKSEKNVSKICIHVKKIYSYVIINNSQDVINALQNNHTLQHLEWYDNRMYEGGAMVIAQALAKNTSLTCLEIKDNEICDRGCEAIAKALETNTTLESLRLWANYINSNGAVSMASALQINTSLLFLDLGTNSIGPRGAISIAQALETNTTLTRLELYANQIGNVGATALAKALFINTSLLELVLSYNQIDCIGAEAIAQSLQSNRTLVTLVLHQDNPIGQQGTRALVDALRMNTTLLELPIDKNEDPYKPFLLRNKKIHHLEKNRNVFYKLIQTMYFKHRIIQEEWNKVAEMMSKIACVQYSNP